MRKTNLFFYYGYWNCRIFCLPLYKQIKDKTMTFREQITNIRKDLIEGIVKFLEENNITELPFGEWGFSDTPVIINGFDDDDTYTLDNISLWNGTWLLGCSSCDMDTDVTFDGTTLETLVDVYEWLMENKGKILEYLAEDKEEAGTC